jgi:hypothetical protein
MVEDGQYMQAFLKQNNFVVEGKWENHEDRNSLAFFPNTSSRKVHCIYVWLANKENQILPLYIGKARNGVVQRMKEHKGGFKEDKNGSVSGRRKRKVLEELVKNKWSIEVYARECKWADDMNYNFWELFELNVHNNYSFQFPPVSLYSIEEELLIRFFEQNYTNTLLLNGINDENMNKLIEKIKTL